MEGTTSREDWRTDSTNVYTSQRWKVDGKWQLSQVSSFSTLLSVFPFCEQGGTPTKRKPVHTREPLKGLRTEGTRCIWWQGCRAKTERCFKICRRNKTSQTPVPYSVVKIYNRSLEKINVPKSGLGDTVYSQVKHLLKITGLNENSAC